MLRFLADENCPGPVLAGLFRRQPDLDIVRAVDVGLGNTDDPVILDWAAKERRIVLTRDTATMVGYIYDRIRQGLPMPGAFVLRDRASHRDKIDALLMVANASDAFEWADRIEYLPWS